MEILTSILIAAVRSGTPVLFATQGEILTERAGNLNVGLEGLMLVGAVFAFMFTRMTGSPWLGILAAMGAGALLSLIHAFLTVTLGANQIVSGLSLVFVGTGLSAVLGYSFVGERVTGFSPVALGFLADIPVIGPAFFNQDALVYLAMLLSPLLWYLLHKTRPGLMIRAVGESPRAADAAGISVVRVQYLCILAGGSLNGLAGAYMSLAYTTMWQPYMTGGRGWIAIALVIFARWDPMRAMLGAYLFGGISALQFTVQLLGIRISPHFLQMMPYLFTILALVLVMWQAKRSGLPRHSAMGPAGLGTAYTRE